MNTSRTQTRGVGLFDALVALAILSFGLLAMTRFQGRMVAQSTDAQARLTATQLADELLNLAIVDAGNVACYTVPAAGACASPTAAAAAAAWKTSAEAALPSAVATSALAGGRLTVTVQWAGKAGANMDGTSDTHRVVITNAPS